MRSESRCKTGKKTKRTRKIAFLTACKRPCDPSSHAYMCARAHALVTPPVTGCIRGGPSLVKPRWPQPSLPPRCGWGCPLRQRPWRSPLLPAASPILVSNALDCTHRNTPAVAYLRSAARLCGLPRDGGCHGKWWPQPGQTPRCGWGCLMRQCPWWPPRCPEWQGAVGAFRAAASVKAGPEPPGTFGPARPSRPSTIGTMSVPDSRRADTTPNCHL